MRGRLWLLSKARSYERCQNKIDGYVEDFMLDIPISDMNHLDSLSSNICVGVMKKQAQACYVVSHRVHTQSSLSGYINLSQMTS
jgi:hypothetical protein